MKYILSVIIVTFLVFGIIELGVQYFLNKFGFTFFMLFSFVFIFVSTIVILNKKIMKFSKFESTTGLILSVYILYSLIGVVFTPETSDALMKVTKQIYWFVMFIMLIQILKLIDVKAERNIYILSGLISFIVLSTMTYFNFIENYSLIDLLSSRWFSISVFNDRNVFITTLLYSLLIFSLFLLKDRNKSKLYVITFFILLVFITLIGILTGSKRIIVLTFIVLLLYFFIFKVNRKLIMFLLVTSLLIVTTYTDFNNYTSESSSIGRSLSLSMNNDLSSNNARFERFELSINVMNEFSILDTLIGRGTSYYKSYLVDYPHNFIISAYIEGGLIKVFILFVLIFSIFFWTYKLKKHLDRNEIFFILSYLCR